MMKKVLVLVIICLITVSVVVYISYNHKQSQASLADTSSDIYGTQHAFFFAAGN